MRFLLKGGFGCCPDDTHLISKTTETCLELRPPLKGQLGVPLPRAPRTYEFVGSELESRFSL